MKKNDVQTRAFVPKARLVQILGEHLIKDATVGLLELVKNSYDADALGVQMTMFRLNSNDAMIEIRDNGLGMDLDTFVSKWMNPASGHKQRQKDEGLRSNLGRLPLGEKGVGRFATQQIGDRLVMISKTKQMKEELYVYVDWTKFDLPEMDLADTKIEFYMREPETFLGDDSGMLLQISGLKSPWPLFEIEKLSRSLRRLKSPFKGANDFDVRLKFVECPADFNVYEDLNWTDVLERAHYRFVGLVDNQGVLDFEYFYNIPGYGKSQKEGTLNLAIEYPFIGPSDLTCGGFTIILHAYDKARKFLKASGVEADLREICGVSVYRDGMRVLPYGEKGNDWLHLDYHRIQSPGENLSNDQIIGMIEINQTQNPLLRDKTNREGLIENAAYSGFSHLVMAVIETLEKEMIDDRRGLRPKREKDPKEEIEKAFTEIKGTLNTAAEQAGGGNDPLQVTPAGQVVASIQKQIEELQQNIGGQVEVFEIERNTLLNLAGTGLAAERFTHEFARLVSGANSALDRLVRLIISDYERIPKVKREIDTIRAALEALRNDIRLLGPMFYIRKAAREKELDLKQIVESTLLLQDTAILKSGIETEVLGNTFTVVMREGSCMQVVNNLLDNSIYWLAKKSEKDQRHIKIVLDQMHRALYVSDSGPGVVPRYRDKIFQPFFSMKGEDGRGLGLYIAKEILQEKNGDILLVDSDDFPGLLLGANFKVLFDGTGEPK